jgi:hypothetical protein
MDDDDVDRPGTTAKAASGDRDDPSVAIARMILPDQPQDIDELAEILRGPSAPVRLPSEREMEVQLVSLQTLDRLFEVQGDADIHKTVVLLAIGGVLGFVTNVATTERFEWTTAASVYLAVTTAITISFAILAFRSHRRLASLRDELKRRPRP